MEPEHDDDYQRLLSRREHLRAERQAAHAAPGRIRLRMGAVMVIIAALLSWLVVSWLTSASSGEALPEPAELSGQPDRPPAEPPAEKVEERAGAAPESDAEDAAPVVVHVAGAVEDPQVVQLQAGDRTADAVDAAGGLADDAAAAGVNLAAEAVDGSFIWVPTVEEFSADEQAPPAASGRRSDGQADQQGPINLNTAGPEQLEELQGIGPALAERIISYREANGEFGSLDELAAVSGIGPAVIENVADDVDW
ncbi:MAG: ComEA family DNA-binding protein [Nesterenkonia sp.]